MTVEDDKPYQFAVSANTHNASSGMVWASCTILYNKRKYLCDYCGLYFILLVRFEQCIIDFHIDLLMFFSYSKNEKCMGEEGWINIYGACMES